MNAEGYDAVHVTVHPTKGPASIHDPAKHADQQAALSTEVVAAARPSCSGTASVLIKWTLLTLTALLLLGGAAMVSLAMTAMITMRNAAEGSHREVVCRTYIPYMRKNVTYITTASGRRKKIVEDIYGAPVGVLDPVPWWDYECDDRVLPAFIAAGAIATMLGAMGSAIVCNKDSKRRRPLVRWSAAALAVLLAAFGAAMIVLGYIYVGLAHEFRPSMGLNRYQAAEDAMLLCGTLVLLCGAAIATMQLGGLRWAGRDAVAWTEPALDHLWHTRGGVQGGGRLLLGAAAAAAGLLLLGGLTVFAISVAIAVTKSPRSGSRWPCGTGSSETDDPVPWWGFECDVKAMWGFISAGAAASALGALGFLILCNLVHSRQSIRVAPGWWTSLAAFLVVYGVGMSVLHWSHYWWDGFRHYELGAEALLVGGTVVLVAGAAMLPVLRGARCVRTAPGGDTEDAGTRLHATA